MADQSTNEQLRANELGRERSQGAHAAALARIQEDLRRSRPPSRIGYLLLFACSAFFDLFDFFEVAGAVGSSGVSELITTPIELFVALTFIGVGFLIHRQVKRIARTSEALAALTADREERAAMHSQQAGQLAQTLRKSGRIRTQIRMPRAQREELKLEARNVIGRITRNSLLQVVPLIELWPWQMTAALFTYRQHYKAHAALQTTLAAYESARAEEQEAFNELQEISAAAQALEQELRNAA